MAAVNIAQFATLLGRIGLNEETVDALTVGQGINHIETFTTVISEGQVKKMSKILSYGPRGNLSDRPAPVPPLLAGADQNARNAHDVLVAAHEAEMLAYRAEVAIQQVHISAVAAIRLHTVWYWGRGSGRVDY